MSLLAQILRTTTPRTRVFAYRRTYALNRPEGGIPVPPPLATLQDGQDSAQASAWIEKFRAREIPKDSVEFTYSRSSGPGGQNVNKVNTKATLRCALESPWIPLWAREPLKKTPAYVSSSQSILITSTAHRSQAQNVQDCLRKLHSIILSAASAGIVKEASDEQKQRVRNLQRAEKAHRRLEKDKRASVKRSRSGSGRDWD